MNISPETINTLLLYGIPLVAALCGYLYQLLVQRLPAQQRDSLEQFATYAAHKVEQVYADAGPNNKKDMATELVADLFKSFGLPVPGDRAVDAAIESAVLGINLIKKPEIAPADPNPLVLPPAAAGGSV